MSLVIQIRDHQAAFSPRDTVIGEVSWQLDTPPKSAELRLLWSTTGRGSLDVGIVETVPFSNPQATETRPFAVKLPDGPYSFSGALITLTWGLELAIDPGDHLAGIEFIVGPEGRAVSLPRIQAPSAAR